MRGALLSLGAIVGVGPGRRGDCAFVTLPDAAGKFMLSAGVPIE
jgi:hypothetical protein